MVITFVAILITLYTSFYVVPEGKQVVITQFGRPIGNPITAPGLHFKTPFVQEVRYIDKRILTWDGYPNQIPTKDKKYIHVDTTARWRIVDALKFIQTVQNERGAKARLDAILDAITRNTISNNNLVEAVRNTNSIWGVIADRRAEIKKQKSLGNAVEEEVTGDIAKITLGRDQLSQIISKNADTELREFGISIVDVQLRRISYEKSVEQKVYERMISERQRIAEKIRSIGKGEKAKIEGRMNKDLLAIQSGAYKTSQLIRGKAEAKAIAIYAKALRKGPKFYEFMRTMDAYKASLSAETQLILSSDSEFFRLFKKK